MNGTTIWYMQLHPGNPEAIDATQIKRLLKSYGVIGLGSFWEDKNGDSVSTPDAFRTKLQIGDVVAVYSSNHADHCFVAIVRVIGECRDCDIKDKDCWFDIVRQVEILDENSSYWKQRFIEETGGKPNKGLFFSTTLQPTYSCEFLNYWYNSIMKERTMKKYIELLVKSKNLILTGAPGTGKTYLARQIARSMVLNEEEKKLPEEEQEKLIEGRVKFVQFHPSYDYTDFVEGLRPFQGADGQVGFKRQDGEFKKLCRAAIRAGHSGGVDNFEEAWDELFAMLEADERLSVPLKSKTGVFPIAFNKYKTGLASRTYDETGEWVRGQSKFFTKEQVYNVYIGNPGVPSGGHDNYRQAIIEYMREHCHLKDYQKGKDVEASECRPFVMIIDEINRGDISKIFGELFYAIDDGYRGPRGRVRTQYQNLVEENEDFGKGFYVPENVYIIGTMNDVDRNVESMDFAIRRRFTWEEIKPEDRFDAMMNGLKDSTGTEVSAEIITQAKKRMNGLNAAICDKKNGLGAAYQIGPSYFAKIKDYPGEAATKFEALWKHHLKPLLCEYLRGMPNADDTVDKVLLAAYEKGAEPQKENDQTTVDA